MRNRLKSFLPMIKLVAFDLDDCLFDSTGLSERARIKGLDAMIELGLDINRNEAISILKEIVKEYGSNSSNHYNYFIKRVNQLGIIDDLISDSEQWRFIAAAVIAYHEEKRTINLFNDVKDCLLGLKERGVRSAIITDGIPIKQYEKILRLGIDDFIDRIVISDEIGIRKPNPKLFDYCLKKFEVKGQESIYVGDRIEKDIIPALLNDIHSVYIHRGGKYDSKKTGFKIPEATQPEFEIFDLNEIFEIIDEINETQA